MKFKVCSRKIHKDEILDLDEFGLSGIMVCGIVPTFGGFTLFYLEPIAEAQP